MKATIWVDGSGTPTTPCACGAHVRIGETDHYFAQKLEHLDTNNQAEVTAVAFGLEKAWNLGAREFQVYSDSQNAVHWLSGAFKCKQPHIYPLVQELRHQIRQLDVRIDWRPREFTGVPDALCHMVHNSPFQTVTISPAPLNFVLPPASSMKTKRSRFYLEARDAKIKRLSSSS